MAMAGYKEEWLASNNEGPVEFCSAWPSCHAHAHVTSPHDDMEILQRHLNKNRAAAYACWDSIPTYTDRSVLAGNQSQLQAPGQLRLTDNLALQQAVPRSTDLLPQAPNAWTDPSLSQMQRRPSDAFIETNMLSNSCPMTANMEFQPSYVDYEAIPRRLGLRKAHGMPFQSTHASSNRTALSTSLTLDDTSSPCSTFSTTSESVQGWLEWPAACWQPDTDSAGDATSERSVWKSSQEQKYGKTQSCFDPSYPEGATLVMSSIESSFGSPLAAEVECEATSTISPSALGIDPSQACIETMSWPVASGTDQTASSHLADSWLGGEVSPQDGPLKLGTCRSYGEPQDFSPSVGLPSPSSDDPDLACSRSASTESVIMRLTDQEQDTEHEHRPIRSGGKFRRSSPEERRLPRLYPRPAGHQEIADCQRSAEVTRQARRRRPSTRSPQTDREPNAQDMFLIQSRQAGMSYRDIQEKGNFSEAESTLRGRYRTLTKTKELRVRKPEWVEEDVSIPEENGT